MEDKGLYETAAQVIPVLFFALLYQLEWFGKSGDQTEDDGEKSDENLPPRFALFDLSIIVLAAVGELVCITVLSEDRTPTESEKFIVLLAVAMLFFPAIVRAAKPRFIALAEAVPRSKAVGRVLVVVLPFGIFVLAVLHVRLMPVVAVGALIFVVVVFATSGVASDYEEGKLRWPRRKRD